MAFSWLVLVVYKGAYVLHVKKREYVTISTWAEYCEAFGRSSKAIDEDLRNLALFGDNFIKLQDSLGIGYRELRKIRAGLLELPFEEQQQKLLELSGAEDKEEALAMVEELEVKLAVAEKKAAELEETMKTRAEIAERNAKARDKAELKLSNMMKLRASNPEKFRLAREEEGRKILVDEINKAIGQMASVATHAATLLSSAEGEGGELITPSLEFVEFINKQVSIMCETVQGQILDAGVEVDFAAYFDMDAAFEKDVALPDSEPVTE